MKIRGLWAVMMCFKMVLRQSDKVNLWWPEIWPFRNVSVQVGCARGESVCIYVLQLWFGQECFN